MLHVLLLIIIMCNAFIRQWSGLNYLMTWEMKYKKEILWS